MDFARKQLEKYGWKEGEGLGKDGNQGIKTAIKPHYKRGKEGMGFDLAEELTDTWWTRSLDASLKNVNVEVDTESGHAVVKAVDGAQNEDAPTVRIHKRMMKANFTQFSKGGTLTQGKLLKRNGAKSDSSSSDSEDDGPTASKISQLTDEQLLLACGGRTAHKGARHGLKCTGKLARLQAQDAYLTANPDKLLPKEERKKKKKSKEGKKKSKKSKEDKERLDESSD